MEFNSPGSPTREFYDDEFTKSPRPPAYPNIPALNVEIPSTSPALELSSRSIGIEVLGSLSV